MCAVNKLQLQIWYHVASWKAGPHAKWPAGASFAFNVESTGGWRTGATNLRPHNGGGWSWPQRVFCTESTLSVRWRSAGADIRDPGRWRNKICDCRRHQLVAPLWNIQFREIRHFCSAITTESKSENSCGRFYFYLSYAFPQPTETSSLNAKRETRRASPSVMKYLKPAFAEFARTLDFRLWIFQAASGRFSPGRKMKGPHAKEGAKSS